MQTLQRSASGHGTNTSAGATSKTRSAVGSVSRTTSTSSTKASLRPADWDGLVKFDPSSSTLASHAARTEDDRRRSMNPPASTSGWSVHDSGPVSYNAAAAVSFQNSSSAILRPSEDADSGPSHMVLGGPHRKTLYARYKRENSETTDKHGGERPVASMTGASSTPSVTGGDPARMSRTPTPIVEKSRILSAKAAPGTSDERRLDEARASVLSILNRDRSPSQYDSAAEISEDTRPTPVASAKKRSSETMESTAVAGKKRKARDNVEPANSQSKKAKASVAPKESSAPAATSTPKTAVAPAAPAAPKASAAPKALAAPKVSATPKATTAPKATSAPKVTPAPKATAVSKATATPKTTATPKPTATSQATSAPAKRSVAPVAKSQSADKGKEKAKKGAITEPEPAVRPQVATASSSAKPTAGVKSNDALRLVAAADSEEEYEDDDESTPSESKTDEAPPTKTVTEETTNNKTVAVFKPTWTPELQNARCMSVRYKDVPYTRCMACTRRWAGDTCRFQNLRYILRERDTREVKAYAFTQYRHTHTPPDFELPNVWSGPMSSKYIQAVKTTVAKALHDVLIEEKNHVENAATIYRNREMDCRATCDTCMTSLFSSVWICRYCGREVCGDCFKRVKFMTYSPPEATTAWASVLQQRRSALKGKAFSLLCSKKREHTCVDFTPITRFRRPELVELVPGVEALAVAPAPPTPVLKERLTYMRAVPPSAQEQSTAAKEHPSHPIPFFHTDRLKDETFKALWAQGSPVVVHGLTPKLGPLWTPEFFIDTYDEQSCNIIDCETDEVEETTVGKFFSSFGKYEGRKNTWKLKDWPSTMEFEAAFPELHQDFCKIVPMPDYVRPDGRENLAGYYPLNVMGPDLGPKMYNAYATTDEPGSQGTTKLHMDMSDAVNIMTSACKTKAGGPGYAIWDIFRASDSKKLRDWLDLKFISSRSQNRERMLDPIHSQRYYLDSQLLAELLRKTGIKSYRIYQEPGQAVFIPAGCAHQVANMADCVKVAIDFVSLENVSRCEQLTREFREANEAKQWKEDVLQLRTMLWFAWLTCCEAEKALEEPEE